MPQSAFRLKRQVKRSGSTPSQSLAMSGSTTLAGGTVNSSYIVPVTAVGGTAPYTFTAVNSLPGGLSVASSGSVLGTPSTTAVSTFTIQVTDNVGSTASQQYKITVNSSAGSGGNAYFDQLSALPECLSSATFSLRASSQLDNLARSSPSTFYTYQFGSDTYATPQDAAKLTIPSSRIKNGNQLDVPINQSDGTLLIIWDHWIGGEWRRTDKGGQMSTRMSAVHNHKSFNLLTSSGNGNTIITFEPNTTFNSSHVSSLVASFGMRNYGVQPNNPPGVTDDQPFAPGGPNSTHTYSVRPAMWNRYIIKMDLNVDASTAFDEWNTLYSTTVPSTMLAHRYSVWFMDETRGPFRVCYHAPAHSQLPLGSTITRTRLDKFNLEHDTSDDHPPSTGMIRFTGVDGASIPSGFALTRTSDGWPYATVSSGTIAGGVAFVRGTANTDGGGGENGNCSTGEGLTLSTLIANVDSTASISSGFSNGIYSRATEGVMYTRNVIVLKNYTSPEFASSTPENDTVIFQLPVA